MLYLANPSTSAIRELIDAGRLGMMASPAQHNRPAEEWTWAADNGSYIGDWQPGRWVTFLDKHAGIGNCLFATVPDRLADPVETRRRWDVWAPVVRELGYRAAYVLQDDDGNVPLDDLDVLFIGGSTTYKLSDDCRLVAQEARRRGIWVHWGRVNSRKRYGMAAVDGDSCDGTFLTYGPDTNLPRLLRWLDAPVLPFAVGDE